MSFSLGVRSRRQLQGVHPTLVAIVERAIVITTQDFAVHEGIRTVEEQRAHVANGTSWTLRSKHLRQTDGWGHAVDLVPFGDGRLTWDWERCFEVAAAMAAAAQAQEVQLRWGGVWDRSMADYGPSGVRQACAAYVRRRRSAGKRAAIDGPHFELVL
jgi:peptidoglycan L-alanyl-D-glutamate endopeptidase CwlK